MTMGSALVLGATGGTGRELVRHLVDRGVDVAAASRSSDALRMLFNESGVRRSAFEPTSVPDLLQAAECVDVVFNCTGPGGHFADIVVAVADALCTVRGVLGVRVVHLSSAWSFTPLHEPVLTEDHPRPGGTALLTSRRRSEDMLADAGATVLHLPDFFGPGVRSSPLQYALRCGVIGTPFAWIAERDVTREYLYVPDAMRAAADLADIDRAEGQRLIVSGSGPIDISAIARIMVETTSRVLQYVTPSEWSAGTAAIDTSLIDGLEAMSQEYSKPIRYDGQKLLRVLPNYEPTAYTVAIPATLAALSPQGAA